MAKIRLIKMERNEQDLLLKKLYIYHENDPIEVCDPYYTAPLNYTYSDDIDWEAEEEKYNNFYKEEIEQDTLRYPYYLEMLAVKKRMAEDPIIFDKEETHYEKDPHKLVNFDDDFTPFFDQESNEVFFKNLENPLRLKWEEIPQKDRTQKIVHFDQVLKRLQYDEVERYFNKYLINKDIAILFLKFMPNIWPVSTFLGPFESYLAGMTGREMYEFFIERVVLLGSSYTPNPENVPVTEKEIALVAYMKEVYKIKEKMFKELLACIKTKPVRLLFKPQEADAEIFRKSDHLVNPDVALESDILTRFMQKYKLYVPHENPDVIKIYNYPAISKLIILLNLSFFNIFPISTNEFEKIRQMNKALYIHFLWFLKDLFWQGHDNTLKVQYDIKTFLSDEEYSKYSNLLPYYPSRMVQAKEYFYSYHNKILREVAVDYLENYFEKKAALDKILYRHNADFYILNKELQAFQKLKEKIYAKSRKLERTPEQRKKIIDIAFEYHKKHQRYLAKTLFREASKQEENAARIREYVMAQKIDIDIENILNPIEKKENKTINDLFTPQRTEITFNNDDELVTYTYRDLILQTKALFIDILKTLGSYEDVISEHKFNEPKKYIKSKGSIYDKLLKKKLIEPNLWNRFEDYCHMAFDKYPETITDLEDLYNFQRDFIEEFMRDIMGYWGKGDYVPSFLNPILKTRRKIKKLKY